MNTKTFKCEPIDPDELPVIELSDGELHRDPVCVDHWHGNGVLFTENHSHCDIIRYLAADMGWDDLLDMVKYSRSLQMQPDPIARLVLPPEHGGSSHVADAQMMFDEPSGEARKSAESASKPRLDLVPPAAAARLEADSAARRVVELQQRLGEDAAEDAAITAALDAVAPPAGLDPVIELEPEPAS